MRSSTAATELAEQASRVLDSSGRPKRRLPRQGRLVELVRETNRRLRRESSPRAA